MTFYFRKFVIILIFARFVGLGQSEAVGYVSTLWQLAHDKHMPKAAPAPRDSARCRRLGGLGGDTGQIHVARPLDTLTIRHYIELN